MKRKECVVCNGSKLTQVIDLGMHCFADRFISEKYYYHSDPTYPLTLDLCDDCNHVQLSTITSITDRYNSKYEYSYISSNSESSKKHWQEYVSFIDSLNLNGKNIVEIGSNDGYLLDLLHEPYNAVGFEPSEAMITNGISHGRKGYAFNLPFNYANAKSQLKEKMTDFVFGNNVLNHIDNPNDVMRAIDYVLTDDGKFAFDVPSWPFQFRHCLFDQIYLEHVNYWSIHSLKKLFEQNGFYLNDFKIVNYHGISLRVIGSRNKNDSISNCIVRGLQYEIASQFNVAESYKGYLDIVEMQRKDKMNKILNLSKDSILIGVGAAAKGNTLLTYYGINNTVMKYVTDASPTKIGKYTPLTRIRIVTDDILKEGDNIYAMILSWNMTDVLKQKLLQINPNIKFI